MAQLFCMRAIASGGIRGIMPALILSTLGLGTNERDTVHRDNMRRLLALAHERAAAMQPQVTQRYRSL